MKLILSIAFLFLLNSEAFSQSTKFSIVHSVPVNNESLMPYSHFALTHFQEKNEGSKLVISYRMPLTLTGAEKELEFYSNRQNSLINEVVFTGSHGKLTCGIEGFTGLRMCEAEYRKDIVSDPQRVLAYIRGLDISDQEKALRLEVALRFIQEPRGILIFYPTPSP